MSSAPAGAGLTVDLDHHVATVEIHRPPNNFFDYDLIHEIANVYERLDADPNCRVIVLCSEGRHFCAEPISAPARNGARNGWTARRAGSTSRRCGCSRAPGR